MISTGRADAAANDDVLLYGLRADARTRDEFVVLPEPLSTEPYSLIIRRDEAAFKDVVNAALGEIFKNGQAERLYEKWFDNPIPPNGINLRLPLSDEVNATFADPRESRD